MTIWQAILTIIYFIINAEATLALCRKTEDLDKSELKDPILLASFIVAPIAPMVIVVKVLRRLKERYQDSSETPEVEG